MKLLLRVFAVILLLILGLISLARRENSGWIAFQSAPNGNPAIYLMTGDGESVHRVRSEYGCPSAPQWSSDGKWIVSFNNCAEVPELIFTTPGRSTRTVRAAGPTEFLDPFLSPDGKWLLVRRARFDLYIMDAHSGESRLLADGYHSPIWSPDSKWIYALTSSLNESRLDRIHVETGRIETLYPPSSRLVGPTLSPDSDQIMIAVETAGRYRFIHIKLDESVPETIPIDLDSLEVVSLRWSPDGEWVAFTGGDSSIYRIHIHEGDIEQLTTQMQFIDWLDWSKDGRWLIFQSSDFGRPRIYRVSKDGSIMEQLSPGSTDAYVPQVSPVPGLDWHPLPLLIAAMGMLLVSGVFGNGGKYEN